MPYDEKQMLRHIAACHTRLEPLCWTPLAALEYRLWRTAEPLPFARRGEGEEITVEEGQPWGRLWDCGWMHITGEIPAGAADKRVVLRLDIGGEALLCDGEGQPLRGLTAKASGFDFTLGRPGKWIYEVTPQATGGEALDYWADIACNDLFGALPAEPVISLCDIAVENEAHRALWYDMSVLMDACGCLEGQSARRREILVCLMDACACLYAYDEAEVQAARGVLGPVLAKAGGDPSLSFTAIGHAHIDLAWLWPIRETRRKVARTFATALEMQRRYPEYIFGQSQPQMFQWLKEDHPALYERLRQAVAQGRVELQGGMWVESDTNVPCGESLIRQFLYGQAFFREEFGLESRMLWLPDVFGYSAALPQIMAGCGIPYFMTQKLSWNEITRFPHHTFRWIGLGGYEVLAHMLPEETYNSPILPHSLKKAEHNYAEAGRCREALILYGIGDGGGGPGEEHLERLARIENFSGLSPVQQGFAQAFFARIDADRERYPSYAGELYLQRHQGTYTSQAKTKQYNRRMEQALHTCEWLLALSGQAEVHREELDAIWKETLLYQFHDILPGSSIARVYQEAAQRYESMLERVAQITQAALAHLKRNGEGYTAINPSPYPQAGWVMAGGKLRHVEVPAYSAQTSGAFTSIAPGSLYASTSRLENDNLRVDFNEDGTIASLYDKRHNRQALQPGSRGNVLALFDDHGGDCWDIPFHYRQAGLREPQLLARRFYTEEDRAVMEQDFVYGWSKINQKLILRADGVRLDIETEVDWRERGLMLRCAFQPDLRSDEVICDIQFGNISRSMREDTAETMAQFEICAHKWIEMREGEYAVALMSDSKYGYSAKFGVLEIDLLRAQNYPGENADLGLHRFAYSVYPHDVREDVYAQAYVFNYPLMLLEGGYRLPELPRLEGESITLETIKPAQAGDGVILRAYENAGARRQGVLRMPEGWQAWPCSMVEDNLGPRYEAPEGAVGLEFGAYEVKTVYLKRIV